MTASSEAIIRAAQDEDDARLQEFCRLFDEIEKRPDADEKLEQIRAVMVALAESGDEEQEAAKRLAEAFATIEEYSDYLPTETYNGFVDSLNDWITNAQWPRDPQLCRQILPLLIAKVIRAEDEKAARNATGLESA